MNDYLITYSSSAGMIKTWVCQAEYALEAIKKFHKTFPEGEFISVEFIGGNY